MLLEAGLCLLKGKSDRACPKVTASCPTDCILEEQIHFISSCSFFTAQSSKSTSSKLDMLFAQIHEKPEKLNVPLGCQIVMPFNDKRGNLFHLYPQESERLASIGEATFSVLTGWSFDTCSWSWKRFHWQDNSHGHKIWDPGNGQSKVFPKSSPEASIMGKNREIAGPKLAPRKFHAAHWHLRESRQLN